MHLKIIMECGVADQVLVWQEDLSPRFHSPSAGKTCPTVCNCLLFTYNIHADIKILII